MNELQMHVVDENDELLGYKTFQTIDYAKDIYRVSALWITNSAGDVLLAQRKIDDYNDSGKWGPAVAGTVEKDETYEDNIYKETSEEIGLTGKTLIIGPKQLIRGERSYFCQWYTLVIDVDVDAFSIQEDEVEKVEWISRDQLIHELNTTPDKFIPGFATITDGLLV